MPVCCGPFVFFLFLLFFAGRVELVGCIVVPNANSQFVPVVSVLIITACSVGLLFVFRVQVPRVFFGIPIHR